MTSLDRQLIRMGPSGDGKTTLLHVLAGILSPDQGEVWLGGDRVDQLNDAARTVLRRRRLGFVFQDNQLVAELPADENVALPPRSTDRRRPDDRPMNPMTDLGLGFVRRSGPGGRAANLAALGASAVVAMLVTFLIAGTLGLTHRDRIGWRTSDDADSKTAVGVIHEVKDMVAVLRYDLAVTDEQRNAQLAPPQGLPHTPIGRRFAAVIPVVAFGAFCGLVLSGGHPLTQGNSGVLLLSGQVVVGLVLVAVAGAAVLRKASFG